MAWPMLQNVVLLNKMEFGYVWADINFVYWKSEEFFYVLHSFSSLPETTDKWMTHCVTNRYISPISGLYIYKSAMCRVFVFIIFQILNRLTGSELGMDVMLTDASTILHF
jgi:hypothetical protein